MGRLALEAFRAAADPARFPEQLREGLRPWQARKIYQGGVGGYGEVPGAPVRVATGVYDPVLGMTWQQLGSRARAMHRCQGMGQLVADPGPAEGVFGLLDAEPAVGRAPRPTSWTASTRRSPASPAWRPGRALAADLAGLQAKAAAARAAFDPASPERAVPALAEALAAVRALARSLEARVPEPAARAEVAERLREEEEDVEAALARAQGLVLEARADDGLVTPGQAVGVAVSLFNSAGGGARAWRRSSSRRRPAGPSSDARARPARSPGAARAGRASR